ncbi:MAG: DHH family phosphoesterase [Acidimicrobiales bacterium]
MTAELADAEISRAVAAISGAPSLALACHVGPDGDALGSMLAFHHLCLVKGLAPVASWSEPFVVARYFTFLPGLDAVVKPADFPPAPEVMLTFDCGSRARLGELEPAAAAAGELIVVDHHATNDHYGTINLVDVGAAATAVVVRRLVAALGWSLDRDAALCLYTGLVTDTGRFQYSNTTPAVFALAEELASFDLPIAAVSRQLFEEHRFAYVQLAGACLGRAELDRGLGLVSTTVTAGDLVRFGVEPEETEGLIDMLRWTTEAAVACVLKETPDGVRGSLRAIDERIDVGAVAIALGGGGHRAASGFTLAGTLAEAEATVKATLRRRQERSDG